MASAKHRVGTAQRIWVVALIFSLIVWVLMDVGYLICMATHILPTTDKWPIMLLLAYLTWMTYKTLRKRMSLTTNNLD
jgi:hypothetical protein